MQITAALVKELRQRTGAGMMDCKRALTETAGDIEAAIEAMRKTGVAKAAGKAGRIAAEGMILIKQGADGSDNRDTVMLEVNCETDFVARDEHFAAFADAVAAAVLAQNPAEPTDWANLPLPGSEQSVEQARLELVAKLGENIGIRRFARRTSEHTLGLYSHGIRIGVIVEVAGGDAALARDLAMHIAAARPLYISEAEVPPELLEKEREIYRAQAAQSDKPPEIIEKMVAGRLKKYLKEITLLGQPFVKEPEQNVAKLLQANRASVKGFVRFEVGEGLEKKADNFAAEVMAQAGLSPAPEHE